MFFKKAPQSVVPSVSKPLLLIFSFQAPSYFVVPTYFVVPREARHLLFFCQKIVNDGSLAKRIKPFNNYNLEILPFPE